MHAPIPLRLGPSHQPATPRNRHCAANLLEDFTQEIDEGTQAFRLTVRALVRGKVFQRIEAFPDSCFAGRFDANPFYERKALE
jgi:hypothetical protein